MIIKTFIILPIIIGIYLNKLTIGRGDFFGINQNDQIFNKIIQQFPKYHLLIHFDNQTIDQLQLIFRGLYNLQQSYHLINYDIKIIEQRPDGLLILNVVLLKNPYNFRRFCSIDYNLEPKDIVIFIVQHQQIDLNRNRDENFVEIIEFWQISGLQWASSILVFLPTTNQLYHCCYYCGNKTGQLQLISNDNNNLPDLHKFINYYNDFNGHRFRIAYGVYPPFFWCQNISNRCEPDGPEGMLLRVISQRLNFKYDLIRYLSELNPRGKWKAMIEAVHFRRVDWAIGGISVSMERGVSTDFTRSIQTQGFSILYASYNPFWNAITGILVISDTITRFTVIFIIVTIIIIVKFAAFIENVNETIPHILRIILTPLTEQPTNLKGMKILKLFSMRSFFAFWWLIMLVITTIYKTKLMSKLIQPKYPEPHTIDDLVRNGFKFQADKGDWSVLRENLILSYDQIYRTVLDNINDKLEICEAIQMAVNDWVAVINEEATIQYFVVKKCRKYLTKRELSRLRLVKHNIFPNTYHGWCMQRSTPFVKKFSHLIGRMHDFGLIQYWYQSAYSYKLPRSNQFVQHETVALTLKDIWPPFLILCFGLTISTLVFLYELCFYRKCIRFRYNFE